MQIKDISAAIPAGIGQREVAELPATAAGRNDFRTIFESIAAATSKTELSIDSGLQQLSKIRASLEGGNALDARQILNYQVLVSELNLRVELLSKAADSAVALTRKLQNAQ